MRWSFWAGCGFTLLISACGGATGEGGGEAGSPAAGGSAASAGGDDSVSGDGGTNGSAGGCLCVDEAISWRRDGGLVPSRLESRLEACADFTYGEVSNIDASLAPCVANMLDCGTGIGIDDVNAALQHPDVRAALAASPILYGGDPRPLDGQVDHIEIGGQIVEIGVPCGLEAPECIIPPGITSLRDLLDALTQQELGDSSCDSQ